MSVEHEPAGSHQSLYRRFRSQTFGELRGQDHVVAGLRNAVHHGTTAHAYLFSGPRGTGKTSAARILAKALNCTDPQPDGDCCGVCESCLSIANGSSLDVLELDAASNNGVEAMRDLISRVGIGSPGRTKVYIVDEVHMLSTGASNALLKTLEEPPDHVKFVLATTDPQKMLATIKSRTQHYEFRLIPPEVLADLVQDVAAEADIELDAEALDAVVRRGHGSARDTLSALELVAAAGYVPDDSHAAQELVAAVADEEPGQVLAAVARGVQAGRDPRRLGVEMVETLRNCFLSLIAPELLELGPREKDEVAALATRLGPAATTRALEVVGECLVEMREALDTRVTLEVALVRLAQPALDTSPAALAQRLERLEAAISGGAVPAAPPSSDAAPASTDHRGPAPAAPAATSGTPRQQGASGPARGRGRPAGEPGQFGPAEARAQLRREADDRTAAAPASPSGPPDSTPPPPGPPPSRTTGRPARPAPKPAGAADREPPAPPASGPSGAHPSTPSADSARPDSSPRATPDTPAPAADVPATPPAPAPSPPDTTSRPQAPGVDELEAAWPKVLEQLSAGTRSRFRSGSFVPEEGPEVVFGFDNQATLERCQDRRAEVEQALSQHFGRPVPLRLVVGGGSKKADGDPGYGDDTGHDDDDQGPPPASSPGAARARAAGSARPTGEGRRRTPARSRTAPPPAGRRPPPPPNGPATGSTTPPAPASAPDGTVAKPPPRPGSRPAGASPATPPAPPGPADATDRAATRPEPRPAASSASGAPGPAETSAQATPRPGPSGPHGSRPAVPAPAHSSPREADADDEDIRMEDLLDAPPAVASDAKQMLLDAFPGSEEIES